jgi:tetratricopeptide (TPR) repeat protein
MSAPSWQEHKQAGNKFYADGKTNDAISSYSKALQDESMNSSERAIILCNRAQCYLKLGENVKAIEDTTSSLTLTPGNVKALFRRAVAFEAIGEKKDALVDFLAVYRISPSVVDAVNAIKRLESALNLPSSLTSTSTSSSNQKGQKQITIQFTEEEAKSLSELQENIRDIASKKASAKSKADAALLESKKLSQTLGALSDVAPASKIYESVGRCYIQQSQDKTIFQLNEQLAIAEKKAATAKSVLEHLGKAEAEADKAFMEFRDSIASKYSIPQVSR